MFQIFGDSKVQVQLTGHSETKILYSVYLCLFIFLHLFIIRFFRLLMTIQGGVRKFLGHDMFCR